MSNERGNLLFNSGRIDLAEKEFRETLVQNPADAMAHAMIGLCLLQKKEYQEATNEAKQSIELAPDWALGYSALATILTEREHLKEATQAIDQAIGLEPFSPHLFAIQARILLKQEKWTDALAAADRGLQIDPEHASCINIRGAALVHLGRKVEAGTTIQGALARDPHNATTHTNQGWALLHAGDHKAAMEHFREALRLDPELQWAKGGMVEAMKAKNPIYRVMLRYFLFMARMSQQARWGIIVGGWLGIQGLNELEKQYPAIQPYAIPIIAAYAIFAILTWLAGPAFNLMLRLDRYGRYALSRDQIVASNWFGGCVVLALVFLILYFTMKLPGTLDAAVLTGLMTMPITSAFNCPKGWPRRMMAGYCVLLIGMSLLLISFDFPFGPFKLAAEAQIQPQQLFNAILVGFVLSGFIANGLSGARVRK